jgi:hypothetical protein
VKAQIAGLLSPRQGAHGSFESRQLDGKPRFLYGNASIKVDLRLVRGKVPAAELF